MGLINLAFVFQTSLFAVRISRLSLSFYGDLTNSCRPAFPLHSHTALPSNPLIIPHFLDGGYIVILTFWEAQNGILLRILSLKRIELIEADLSNTLSTKYPTRQCQSEVLALKHKSRVLRQWTSLYVVHGSAKPVLHGQTAQNATCSTMEKPHTG